jgi:hypothetical protein
MSEYVRHHVKEEQNAQAKVKASKLDLAEIGLQMEQRKQELMAGKKA